MWTYCSSRKCCALQEADGQRAPSYTLRKRSGKRAASSSDRFRLPTILHKCLRSARDVSVWHKRRNSQKNLRMNQTGMYKPCITREREREGREPNEQFVRSVLYAVPFRDLCFWLFGLEEKKKIGKSCSCSRSGAELGDEALSECSRSAGGLVRDRKSCCLTRLQRCSESLS